MNKSLGIFIGIGFVVTIVIWGFVGGCGSMQKPLSQSAEEPSPVSGEKTSEHLPRVEKGTTYTVVKGDSLWKISQRFGVTIIKIKEANSLINDQIEVGQRLLIPGAPAKARVQAEQKKTEKPERKVRKKTQASSDLIVYRVRKGDSLWRIAQIHGVTIKRVAELNGIPHNARLSPGQELLVPKDK